MRGVRGSGRALRRLRLRLRLRLRWLRRLRLRWLLRQRLLRRRQLLRQRLLVWAVLLARVGGVEAASAPRRLLDGRRRDPLLALQRAAPPGEGEG